MQDEQIRLRFLLGVLLVSIFGGVARAEPLTLKELNARPDELAFHAYFNQISSLSGKFVIYDAQDHITETRTFAWDGQRDYFNGTIRKAKPLPGDRPDISVWVFGPAAEWTATSAVSDLKDPGALFVNVNPSSGGGRPRAISRTIFKVDLISVMHKPFHLRVPSSDIEAADRRIDVSEIPQAGGSVLRSYDVFRGTRKASRLEYVLDKSDGIRLFSSTLIIYQKDKPNVEFLGKYGDYRKSNGVWYPRTVEETNVSYENAGPVATKTKIRMLEATVNPVFSEKTFVYDIPYGSRVSDERTGTLLLWGYNSPNRASGDDQLSKDLQTSRDQSTVPASSPEKVDSRKLQSAPEPGQSVADTRGDSTFYSAVVSIPGAIILGIVACGVGLLLLALWRRR